MQKAIAEIARRLPKGKALRILEIGGGTGGTTSFVLPVLPEHCTEYVFTDVSPRFMAHAQHKFAQYPFVQFRTLDIERDPLEQGFDAHSFDVIIASDVLHATQDLRKTLDRVKQLLGSCGTLVLLELTRPWLITTLVFGLLKGWWLFEERPPAGRALRFAGAMEELAARGGIQRARSASPIARTPTARSIRSFSRAVRNCPHRRHWRRKLPRSREPGCCSPTRALPDRPSAGAELALKLRERGDRVIEVTHGAEFRQWLDRAFTIRAGDPDDMRAPDGGRRAASRRAWQASFISGASTPRPPRR